MRTGSEHADPQVRLPTMTDVLEFVNQSRQAFHVVRLPEMTVVAANVAAVELYAENGDSIVGRSASSLFRGADEVHAAVALSALAAEAIDSYCVQCRSTMTSAVKSWLCVRRLDVGEGRVALAMTVPAEQKPPLDAVEEEVATVKGIGWISAWPTPGTAREDESDSGHVADSAFDVLDRLPARQREIVAALLRGERTSATAAAMFLSSSTVRSHLTEIFKAFGVHSQTELLGLLRSQKAI